MFYLLTSAVAALCHSILKPKLSIRDGVHLALESLTQITKKDHYFLGGLKLMSKIGCYGKCKILSDVNNNHLSKVLKGNFEGIGENLFYTLSPL